VAEVEIRQDAGMGRIAWHWRDELRRRGHEFVHIGPAEVGTLPHRGLFPFKAWHVYKQMNRRADVLLVHEPASGVFVRRGIPVAVFSHGLERRNWQQRRSDPTLSEGPLTLRTRLLFPVWRLRQCDRGIRHGDLLLLTNREDCEFAARSYGRRGAGVFLFQNGVDPVSLSMRSTEEPSTFTVAFNGSWIPRKGIDTLKASARILNERGLPLRWLLLGTQRDAAAVLHSWPDALRGETRVIPSFSREQERDLLAGATLFVLPSIYEGQPLSLLQAMAAARCCVATDCCGQRDLIRHGVNGVLFPVGDARRLAHLVEQYFHDRTGRQRLGSQAQSSVRDRLWEDVAGNVAERILAIGRGARRWD
jgi:glycosyltransferase involved in cell wall biosynthesis